MQNFRDVSANTKLKSKNCEALSYVFSAFVNRWEKTKKEKTELTKEQTSKTHTKGNKKSK